MKKTAVTIIHPVDPAGVKIGGIGTMIRDFIRFAPPDFELRLVGITTDRRSFPPGRWHSSSIGGREFQFFPVRYVPSFKKKPLIPLGLTFMLKSIFYYRAIDRSAGDTILHFHRPECVLPFLMKKTPRFFFIHSNPRQLGGAYSASKWRRIPSVYFLMEKVVLRVMKRVYCVSREGLVFYRRRFPEWEEKFQFLGTGLNRKIFYRRNPDRIQVLRDRFHARYRLDPQAEIILFVGRFVEPKNLPLLVETFRICHSRNHNLRLLLIGEGPLEETIRSLIRENNLQNEILLLGRRDQEEIARIANICSLFILTSVFEGMPISLLEVMNCGLPAVVTGVGETGNVVEDGFSGQVVESAEPVKLAEAVEEVIGHPDRYLPANPIASVKPYLVDNILSGVYSFQRMVKYEKTG